jgi:Ca2+/H+ antiporter
MKRWRIGFIIEVIGFLIVMGGFGIIQPSYFTSIIGGILMFVGIALLLSQSRK